MGKRKNEDNTTVNARFMVKQTITQRSRITQFCKNESLTNFVIEEHNRTRKIYYRVYQSTKRWRVEKMCLFTNDQTKLKSHVSLQWTGHGNRIFSGILKGVVSKKIYRREKNKN